MATPRQVPAAVPVTKRERPRSERSVRDVTYDLLRELGLTTIFGNLGSTEETFLKNFPKKAVVEAWKKSKPTVLEIPISPQVRPLL